MTKIRVTLQYAEIDNKHVMRKYFHFQCIFLVNLMFERYIHFLSKLILSKAKAIFTNYI